jgi:hypothetical protein
MTCQLGFPIQFAKPGGGYDFTSPLINLTGNGLVITGVAVLVAALVKSIFTALGYSAFFSTALSGIPLAVGGVGLVWAAVGILSLGAILLGAMDALGRR